MADLSNYYRAPGYYPATGAVADQMAERQAILDANKNTISNYTVDQFNYLASSSDPVLQGLAYTMTATGGQAFKDAIMAANGWTNLEMNSWINDQAYNNVQNAYSPTAMTDIAKYTGASGGGIPVAPPGGDLTGSGGTYTPPPPPTGGGGTSIPPPIGGGGGGIIPPIATTGTGPHPFITGQGPPRDPAQGVWNPLSYSGFDGASAPKILGRTAFTTGYGALPPTGITPPPTPTNTAPTPIGPATGSGTGPAPPPDPYTGTTSPDARRVTYSGPVAPPNPTTTTTQAISTTPTTLSKGTVTGTKDAVSGTGGHWEQIGTSGSEGGGGNSQVWVPDGTVGPSGAAAVPTGTANMGAGTGGVLNLWGPSASSFQFQVPNAYSGINILQPLSWAKLLTGPTAGMGSR